MSRIVIDIETNGLFKDMVDYSSFPYKLKESAKLWCICLYNIDTKESKSLVLKDCTKEKLQEELKDCTELIGHNIIKFDLLALKLFNLLDYHIKYFEDDSDLVFGKPCKITDTHVWSRLFYPDRYGGHSLESWGERVGVKKIDFRQVCIDAGHIHSKAPKGAEFQQFCPEMVTYCVGDVTANADVYLALEKEKAYHNWDWENAIILENKIADKGIRRENLGFFFDKPFALKCLDDLNSKMEELQNIVNPLLPPKPMNKGELKNYTPVKRQYDKDGNITPAFQKFLDFTGATVKENKSIVYESIEYPYPYYNPLKTYITADINHMDHVKMYLIQLSWIPSEWRIRDLTKDSKKQSISYEKRIKALKKWYNETIDGKYKNNRLSIMKEEFNLHPDDIISVLSEKLKEDKPVRVPTSPCVRVGVEKNLCPSLIELGEKVSFAKDFALYLTYKHRKNSIAGGEIEDMDFDLEDPNTGFLSIYREEDGRIPTAAIELGCNTARYVHIKCANIPRIESIYGKEMRSLFGCGENFLQLAFDFSSLEARIQGHYIYKYTGGQEASKTLLAEKPLDIHTLSGIRFNIPRGDAKSLNYAILYGSQIAKIMKMLRCNKERATEIFNDYWEFNISLKELKEAVERYWELTNKKYIKGIDGRKIFVRSKHSIINALFQSAGAISAKYTTIYIYKLLEDQNLVTDPFKGVPDFCSMIEYHDELEALINKKIPKVNSFNTKEEALDFVEKWKGPQLSAIGHGKKYYVGLPNIVTKAITEAINITNDKLKLNVPLGYEWNLGRNWADCH